MLSAFERALKELQLGNYSGSIAILQRLLEGDPDYYLPVLHVFEKAFFGAV